MSLSFSLNCVFKSSTFGNVSFSKMISCTSDIMASFSISDHVAIPQVGWYAHLLVSSIAMFIMCIFYPVSRKAFSLVLKDRRVIYAGIFYTASEFLVIYASINILPVSIVVVFLRLSVPVIMIISAIKLLLKRIIH